MLQQLILCFIGFCAGIIVAGGVSGLLIGLSIVPRYAGITHTADQIFLYEDLTLLGTVAGTVVTLFPIRIPLGPFFLAVCGVFFGIFLGGWILALAEIAKVFPVFARRLKLSQGLSPVIISIAAGKALGNHRPSRQAQAQHRGFALPYGRRAGGPEHRAFQTLRDGQGPRTACRDVHVR